MSILHLQAISRPVQTAHLKGTRFPPHRDPPDLFWQAMRGAERPAAPRSSPRRRHHWRQASACLPSSISPASRRNPPSAARRSCHALPVPYSCFSKVLPWSTRRSSGACCGRRQTSSGMHLHGGVACNRRGVAQHAAGAMERIIPEVQCTPLGTGVTPGAGAKHSHTARSMGCPDVLRKVRTTGSSSAPATTLQSVHDHHRADRRERHR